MKKLLILSITVFTLFSCSSNDNNNIDPIIGSWYLFADDNIEVSDCRKQSKYIFNSDRTGSITIFEDNQPCSSDPTENLNWENIENNKYKITYMGIGGVSTLTFTFFDNNNTMKVGDRTLKRQ